MEIKTNDGNKYKLNWIEEKDGNVISIKNTKRTFVDKSEITSIFKYDPELIGIGKSLELALEHNGAVQIRTEKHTYDFIKIEEQGDLIKGITKLDGDTLSVVIPKDKIEIIKLKDHRPLNNATLNLFGDASIVSINYERLFLNSSNFFLSAKVGLGYNRQK